MAQLFTGASKAWLSMRSTMTERFMRLDACGFPSRPEAMGFTSRPDTFTRNCLLPFEDQRLAIRG